jgi:hypothetical protein
MTDDEIINNLYSNNRVVAEKNSGQYFGEIALLSNEKKR